MAELPRSLLQATTTSPWATVALPVLVATAVASKVLTSNGPLRLRLRISTMVSKGTRARSLRQLEGLQYRSISTPVRMDSRIRFLGGGGKA